MAEIYIYHNAIASRDHGDDPVKEMAFLKKQLCDAGINSFEITHESFGPPYRITGISDKDAYRAENIINSMFHYFAKITD